MYCKKCGHLIEEGSGFCSGCGLSAASKNETVLIDEQTNGVGDKTQSLFGHLASGNTAAVTPRGTFNPPVTNNTLDAEVRIYNTSDMPEPVLKLKEKKKSKLPIIIVIVLVLVIGGAAAAVFGVSALNTKKYDELIDTGNKYLEELKYEEAVETYLEAIDIKPKREEAYVGAATGYIGLGEPEKAKEILEEGLDNVKEPGKEFTGLCDELGVEYENSSNEKADSNSSVTEGDDLLLIQKNAAATYKKILINTFNKYLNQDAYCGYTLYDIDEDGIKELIVKEGLSENGYVINVYTHKNNESLLLGSCGGWHTSLFGGQGYIVLQSGMSYDEVIRHLSIINGKLLEETVSNGEVEAWTVIENPLSLLDIQDFSLIDIMIAGQTSGAEQPLVLSEKEKEFILHLMLFDNETYDSGKKTTGDAANMMDRHIIGALGWAFDYFWGSEGYEAYYYSGSQPADPLNKFSDSDGYAKYDATKVDWIVRSIFNAEPVGTKEFEGYTAFYLHNGYYYAGCGATGYIGPEGKIKSAKELPNGDYEIVVDYYDFDDGSYSSSSTAIFKPKTIDGTKYWSIVRITPLVQ